MLRGAIRSISGEVIFNTSMTGYQEILTDPSYYKQIVTMTCTQIGNYGINEEDDQSRQPFAAALVMRELSPIVSNWRSSMSLEEYALKHGIPLLEGIDTRSLVIAIREEGAVPGLLAPADEAPIDQLIQKARQLPCMEGQSLVSGVSTKATYTLASKENLFRVVAYDYGIKQGILDRLQQQGLSVEVFPFDTSPEVILEKKPDGLFLSNGPSDPEALTEAVRNIRALLGRVPIFGICLGCQLLALALGGRTYKLKFGHHGVNHPVMRLQDRRVEITSQNHGFAITEDNLPAQICITHRNLNDQTIAGIQSTEYPAFAVQYHPEASPGPHDSRYLFQQFTQLMRDHSRQLA